jgi:hypothetical protein
VNNYEASVEKIEIFRTFQAKSKRTAATAVRRAESSPQMVVSYDGAGGFAIVVDRWDRGRLASGGLRLSHGFF